MFILRRVDQGHGEANTCLGVYYVLTTKERNKQEFDDIVKLWSEEDKNQVYGVITFDDGESIMPLYANSKYYIMTSNGNTFANVSQK